MLNNKSLIWKIKRYLVIYIACLTKKNSWASSLINVIILLMYWYWLVQNKTHKDYPFLWPVKYYTVSLTVGAKEPNMVLYIGAIHSPTHIHLPHCWIYDGTERNFSKLQSRCGITPLCGFTSAFWKSRYPSQNRPCLDKRTLNPREKEVVIVRDASHTHTTWSKHATSLEVWHFHKGPEILLTTKLKS